MQPKTDSDQEILNSEEDMPFETLRRPFRRPRENLATCPISLCRDEKGEWTKWVLERLDEQQLATYNEYMKLVNQQPVLAKISVNNHLRFLNGSKWNIKTAFDFMMASEKYRIDTKIEETTLDMIQPVVDMNYVVTHGHDRVGRPIMWINIQNYNPNLMTRDQAMHFMCYLIDYAGTLMKPNVDQYLIVCDMLNFGWSKFNMEIMKACIEVSGVSFFFPSFFQTLYSQRVYKVLVLNPGYVFSMMYSSVKPFLLERQRQRIVFVETGKEAIKNELLKLISEETIPSNFGGMAPELESLKQKFPPYYT